MISKTLVFFKEQVGFVFFCNVPDCFARTNYPICSTIGFLNTFIRRPFHTQFTNRHFCKCHLSLQDEQLAQNFCGNIFVREGVQRCLQLIKALVADIAWAFPAIFNSSASIVQTEDCINSEAQCHLTYCVSILKSFDSSHFSRFFRLKACYPKAACDRRNGSNGAYPIGPFCDPHFGPGDGKENKVREVQKYSNDTRNSYGTPLRSHTFVGFNDWGKVNKFFNAYIHRFLSWNNYRNNNMHSIGCGK